MYMYALIFQLIEHSHIKCRSSSITEHDEHSLASTGFLWRSCCPRSIFNVCELGAVSIRKTVLPGMAIPMLKIRRPNGRLIFNMEIAIRRYDGLYIETGPWRLIGTMQRWVKNTACFIDSVINPQHMRDMIAKAYYFFVCFISAWRIYFG